MKRRHIRFRFYGGPIDGVMREVEVGPRTSEVLIPARLADGNPAMFRYVLRWARPRNPAYPEMWDRMAEGAYCRGVTKRHERRWDRLASRDMTPKKLTVRPIMGEGTT